MASGNSLFVFGGQDEDNTKLSDLWEFNLATKHWAHIAYTSALQDIGRSGHAAVAFGGRMYVFGGILEVTKELNDLLVYDFKTQKLSVHEGATVSEASVHHMRAEDSLSKAQGPQEGSPVGRGKTMPSPARKGSPGRKTAMATTGSPMSKSPTKKFQASATFNSTAHHEGDKRLSSPTSVTMKNSFIIKSADESFDAYYQAMKRRRHANSDSPAATDQRMTTF